MTRARDLTRLYRIEAAAISSTVCEIGCEYMHRVPALVVPWNFRSELLREAPSGWTLLQRDLWSHRLHQWVTEWVT